MNIKITLKTTFSALTFALFANHTQGQDVVFGVPVLDGAEHDYVIEGRADNVGYKLLHTVTEFGVAILDEAQYDYTSDTVSDSGESQYALSSDRGFSGFGVAILDDSGPRSAAGIYSVS